MSNDLKYVLLPTIEERPRQPKFQPWYRERLRMKYPCNINTKNWKFVKDGLDDFRDGLPPPHEDIILEPDRGPGPVLKSESRRIKSSVSNAQHRLKEHQLYFSKELPATEKRRETIDTYISTILDHPMAFFEHFNKTLPPEMYERLTKLLESELLHIRSEDNTSLSDEIKDTMSLSQSAAATRPDTTSSEKSLPETSSPGAEKITETGTTDTTNQPQESTTEQSDSIHNPTHIGRSGVVYDESGVQWSVEELERKQKNPYRWFIDKEHERETAKGPTPEEIAASAMESRLRNVSEKFCDWLYDLGGHSNQDIDPGVVRNLFSTAYDTKPSLSVPIKIVEMTRVPIELREGAQDTMFVAPDKTKRSVSAVSKKTASTHPKRDMSAVSHQESRGGRYRYGAWYLSKNLWQRSKTSEELRDPKIVKAELEDETKKQEEKDNARLAPLHGVDAFKEYLQERNFRRLPKLISGVENYRRGQQREFTSIPNEPQQKRSIASAP